MRLVQTLLERDHHAQPALTPALRELYDGDLQLPTGSGERPYVFANFVSTLDGTASFKIAGQSSGKTVSGADPADRFIMGLLRASADAVLAGANTIHDTSPSSRWIPPETYPDAKDLFRDYRLNVLHKPEYPPVVIVSGSGRLDLKRTVFQAPEVSKLILTTAAGEKELMRRGGGSLSSVRVKALADVGAISAHAILQVLGSEFGVRRLLHEGGPTLFGEFLVAGLIDECFLTLAPQMAGRAPGTVRPGILEGAAFAPESAPWFELRSVKQQGEYLYLRYRRSERRAA